MVVVLTSANPDRHSRATFWLRTGLLLAVALCVFGWGTGYKLSLYQPKQTEAPHAKLCIRTGEAERSSVVRAHVERAHLAEPESQSAFLAPAAPAVPSLVAQPPRPRQFLSHLFVAALFLRPPPAI